MPGPGGESGERPRGRRAVRALLARIRTPRAIISAVFGLGLLAAVLALGDLGQASHLIVRSGWRTVVGLGLLTIPYLAARFLVWRRLLAGEGVALPWRPVAAAFAAGEFSRSLPGGVYVEDLLLQRWGVRIATSLVATTAVSVLETLIALPIVLGYGVPGWSWLRPTLIGLMAAYGIGLAVLLWIANPGGKAARVKLPRPFGAVVRGIRQLIVAARPLLAVRTARDTLVPELVSLTIAAVDVWLLGRAVGIHGLSFAEAAVAYGFSLLVLNMTPVPTDLGATEASGAGALLAFGATGPQAVATLLLLRIVLTGGTMLLTGPLLLTLSRQLSPSAAATPSPLDGGSQ